MTWFKVFAIVILNFYRFFQNITSFVAPNGLGILFVENSLFYLFQLFYFLVCFLIEWIVFWEILISAEKSVFVDLIVSRAIKQAILGGNLVSVSGDRPRGVDIIFQNLDWSGHPFIQVRCRFLDYFEHRWPNLGLIEILPLIPNLFHFLFLLAVWGKERFPSWLALWLVSLSKEGDCRAGVSGLIGCLWLLATFEKAALPRLKVRLVLVLLGADLNVFSLYVLSHRTNPRQPLFEVEDVLPSGDASNIHFELVSWLLVFEFVMDLLENCHFVVLRHHCFKTILMMLINNLELLEVLGSMISNLIFVKVSTVPIWILLFITIIMRFHTCL